MIDNLRWRLEPKFLEPPPFLRQVSHLLQRLHNTLADASTATSMHSALAEARELQQVGVLIDGVPAQLVDAPEPHLHLRVTNVQLILLCGDPCPDRRLDGPQVVPPLLEIVPVGLDAKERGHLPGRRVEHACAFQASVQGLQA